MIDIDISLYTSYWY